MFLQTYQVPFFVSYFDNIPENKNHIFYQLFSLDLYFDEKTGLVHQHINEEKQRLLDNIYKQGSIIYQSFDDDEYEEGEHLQKRKNQFLELFFSIFSENEIKGKDILEIGCGPGYLLNEFKKRGANVIGCDPGPFQSLALNKFGIEIIPDYFSDNTFMNKRFDIIISYAFLTGINDPLTTLIQMKNLLKKKGKVLTAVADYTPHLELGNIFCITPEQVNYFTQKAIKNLYLKAGLGNIQILNSSYGSGMQILGDNSSQNEFPDNEADIQELKMQAQDFKEKANVCINKLQDRINKSTIKSLGIMGANIETVNLLHYIDFKEIKIYLYEYDKTFINKYLPSVEIPISHEENIIDDSPNEIWCVPIAFADKIEKKLIELFGVNASLLNMRTFLKSL